MKSTASYRITMAGTAYTEIRRSCRSHDQPMRSWSIECDEKELDVVSIRYREKAVAVTAAGVTATARGCRAAPPDECLLLKVLLALICR